MRRLAAGFAALTLLGLSFVAAQEAAKPKPAATVAPTVTPTEGVEGDLRKPGFLFLELRVRDIAKYPAFLRDVAGYKVVRSEPDFMMLQTDCGEILLGLEPKPADPAAPRPKHGVGVEIGIVVGDIEKAHAAAANHEGWRIVSHVQMRPWGVRDFRVFSPDGYYVRVTE